MELVRAHRMLLRLVIQDQKGPGQTSKVAGEIDRWHAKIPLGPLFVWTHRAIGPDLRLNGSVGYD